MKVFWVLGCDNYYPGGDNFCASFLTYDEAEAYIAERKQDIRHYDNFWIIDISERL